MYFCWKSEALRRFNAAISSSLDFDFPVSWMPFDSAESADTTLLNLLFAIMDDLCGSSSLVSRSLEVVHYWIGVVLVRAGVTVSQL